ncbi:MAG: hypothetical protein FWD88_06260 [Treponema sp.]|nr:hypothetical protein [Treponema sp.]
MGANKLEAFDIEVTNRKNICGADYNPRKITESAKKKLRQFLKENGLWQPLVMNRRTGTLVSGHQRLAIMDSLLRRDDYELTMSVVDVDEKTEASGNVFMNNQSAMGEWDVFALQDIKAIFPDIDFEHDMGFDESDINILFGRQEEDAKLAEEQAAAQEYTADHFREAKKETRENARRDNRQGDSYNLAESDYVVQIVFPNNHEKREFMRKIRKPENEKFLKSTVLLDIYNRVHDISIFGGKD